MNIDDTESHLAQITKSLKTSSAVVPALLLTLICVPCGLLGAKFSEPPIQIIFIGLAILPPILTIAQIVFFTFWDRDRLQNEEHVERKMLIGRMRAEFGDAHSTIEIEKDAKLIGNPSFKDGGHV